MRTGRRTRNPLPTPTGRSRAPVPRSLRCRAA
jgi:hypothetical protein